jgi:enterochelin esterase-like enzyme
MKDSQGVWLVTAQVITASQLDTAVLGLFDSKDKADRVASYHNALMDEFRRTDVRYSVQQRQVA